MLRSVALAAALLLIAPMAASAPLLYVGLGSGTIVRSYDFDCPNVDVHVFVSEVDGRWFPTIYEQQYGPDGLPCNLVASYPILPEVMGEETVSGSPETGFVIDFPVTCGSSALTIGPLGPQTEYRRVILDNCSGRSKWTDGTVAFEAVG